MQYTPHTERYEQRNTGVMLWSAGVGSEDRFIPVARSFMRLVLILDGTVEDWLAAFEFFEDAVEPRIGKKHRLHLVATG
jgi:hypothetical protein